MPQPIRVLHIEDDVSDAELILRELRRSGLDVEIRRVASAPEVSSALAGAEWDVILCDFRLPGFGAIQAFEMVRANGQRIPFIVVTGTINEETAVECLKLGIDNYVLKENLARLAPAVQQALRMSEERKRSRRLEEEVRQSQKMEAVGRLAGGVAHDFNNLLTVIFANAARLRKALPGSAGGNAELDAIEAAARQAKGVTDSLLALCHKSATRRAPVEVVGLVRDAARLLRRALPAGLEMSIEAPEGRPLWVDADSTQLHQVLMNLAINSRDAMPSGGKLRFQVRTADPDKAGNGNGPDRAGDRVTITVSDTGTGMTDEVAARAFEPFFTTKPRGQGTGLGLAVVHGIIAEHEGKIDLSSTPGSGTRVSITLPLCAPPTAASAPARVEIPSSMGGGVAIVAEDNELIRGLLVTTLEGMGFVTREAADGRASLRAVREIPDAVLVILDLDLPKLNGTVTLDEIKRRSQPLPTLLITGNPQFEHEGGPAWITLLRKPFQIDEFRGAVAGLLRVAAAAR